MICLYLNYRGYGNSSKEIALKILVEAHRSNIILLQGSMGQVKKTLMNWLKCLRVGILVLLILGVVQGMLY
jgi:hypothetical protein